MDEKQFKQIFYDEYEKYDELCNKILHKFRSNWISHMIWINIFLKNFKNSTFLKICENFQFNAMIFISLHSNSLLLHSGGRALCSDWSENSFIMAVYKNFF